MVNVALYKVGTAAPSKFPSLPISHPLQTIDSASTRGSATILTKSSKICLNLMYLNYFGVVAHG